ncbi:hypothetical protein JKF63_05437 [Porcisia hertigi]|uniref:Uncharacterized protein n=1 Tax=Porcisia hertigi TaxID=2761500 RepID=A0A836HYR0_9TRYP|nr:hypothetical protein JKF63_05437 [Porcisia hertigi]
MHLHPDTRLATPVASFGGVGGSDGVLPASASRLAEFSLQSVVGVTGQLVTSPERPASSLSPAQLADAALPDHSPPQRPGRRWTPRRGSLHSGVSASGGGGAVAGSVATLRDWVRSAGCSPSKQPRSASTSRRDSLASSFASSLVPREGQWELSHPWTGDADGDSGQGREGHAEPGSRTEPSGSSRSSAANSGCRWASVSLSISEAPVQQLGVREGVCTPTSPQRSPSWRHLRSHPTTTTTITPSDVSVPSSHGSSNGTAALLGSSASPFFTDHRSWHDSGPSSLVVRGRATCSTTVHRTGTTLLGQEDSGTRGGGGDGGGESRGDQLSLSRVSSPSFVTPLPSPRHTAPSGSAMNTGPLPLSSSPALAARELAKLGEWRSIIDAQRGANVPAAASIPFLPPPRPSASEGYNDGLASRRSGSPSRESMRTLLSDGRWGGGVSVVQTPLEWVQGGTSGDTGGVYGSTCPSPTGWSTSELDQAIDGFPLEQRRAGHYSPASSPIPVSLAEKGGLSFVRHGMPYPSPITSPRLSSPSSTSPVHSIINHGCGGEGDDSGMDDIEVRDVKRKCVESPRVSPLPTSLRATPQSDSFAFSLADALAAEPTSVAMQSEVRLWQQQQRRKRTVSPSVARPDEEQLPFNDVGKSASTHHRARCTFSPTSPIRTTAPSMIPMHSPPQLLDTPLSSSLLLTGECVQPHDMGGGPPHVPSVDDITTVLGHSKNASGFVVEVDDQLAASLSRCCSNGSDDEPEVDTYSLERTQAAMEDADTEVTSALCMRQHQLYLLATSQFARDVERHGGHVDPVQLELEGEDEAEEGGKELARSRGFPVASGSSSAGQRGNGAARPRWEECGSPSLSQDRGTAKEEAGVSSSPTAAYLPQSHTLPASPCSPVFRATPTAPAATPLVSSRVSGEESFGTPLHRGAPISGTITRLRWSEPEESEGGYSPISVATTTESQSRRDVSPPIRERSMAPAELRKEREGY